MGCPEAASGRLGTMSGRAVERRLRENMMRVKALAFGAICAAALGCGLACATTIGASISHFDENVLTLIIGAIKAEPRRRALRAGHA